MNEPDLPSDSDISDEDYRPSGEESGAASEEESGPDDDAVDNLNEDGEDAEDGGTKQSTKISKKDKKRTKKVVKRKTLKRKKAPVEEVISNDSESQEEEKKVDPEEQKKKADSLWADFMKDCGGPAKKKPSLDNSAISSTYSNGSSVKGSVINNVDSTSTSLDKKSTATDENETKTVVTEVFEFAGEKVSVEKEVSSNPVVTENGSKRSSVAGMAGRGHVGRGAGRGGGSSALTSFLGQLGKKGKLSTLEKSKLDWDQFKKKEGIDEDIQIHNKGKDGYLERQDFLQRTDLRRFEIEKSFRQKRGGR